MKEIFPNNVELAVQKVKGSQNNAQHYIITNKTLHTIFRTQGCPKDGLDTIS